MKAAHATLAAACAAQTALLNGGTLVLYSGTRPANGDASLSSNNALATLTFSATAFGTPTAAIPSVATANAITSGTGTAAAGAGTTATFARCFKSDTTTAVCDLSVGTSGTDVVIATTTIVQNVTVSCSSCTWTQNDQGT